ncbi:MAG: hypothetical protein U1F06_03965 [Steroidobacteraceae bacterium]
MLGRARELVPLQFLDRREHVLAADGVALAAEGRQHRRVAQRVGQARRAAGVAEDQLVGVRREDLPPLRARDLEAVQDVGDHVLGAEAREVEAQAHALRELDQFRRVELLVQLRLAGEDDAQHLLLRRLDAGEHAHLLEHALGEVLRLVDDQQHLAAGGVLLDEEVVERRQQLGLLHLEGREAELRQHRLQELDRRDLRLVDLGDDHVLAQLLQEGLDQRGLAGADFPGDHDEAVGEPDGRLHVRLGARVALAEVQELRVRAQPEGQFAQLEELEVHGSGGY